MNLEKLGWIIGVILMNGLLLGTQACKPNSSYAQLMEEELAKGVRYDSLFLGLHLGMHVKEFYGVCWDLNGKGIIRQGPRNESVMYKLEDLGAPATLNFYPEFHEENIYEMPCIIVYDNWAPWHKDLSGDSLAARAAKMFEDWYGGNAFIKVEHAEKGTAYFKVDGNRRITMRAFDEELKVKFTDIALEKQLRKAEKK